MSAKDFLKTKPEGPGGPHCKTCKFALSNAEFAADEQTYIDMVKAGETEHTALSFHRWLCHGDRPYRFPVSGPSFRTHLRNHRGIGNP